MLLKKLKAVSYVEVILVLVVIGVVSSMAIPTLKKYTQKQEFAKGAQKAFYTLNEVVDNAITTKGPIRKVSAANVFNTFLKPSFKANGSGSNYVITKDGMRFEQYYVDSNASHIIVDVNGTAKGPNVFGKDKHYFDINLKTGKVIPQGDTATLYKNNWTYTDALWNK